MPYYVVLLSVKTNSTITAAGLDARDVWARSNAAAISVHVGAAGQSAEGAQIVNMNVDLSVCVLINQCSLPVKAQS